MIKDFIKEYIFDCLVCVDNSFELKFSIEDVLKSRESMIKSGQIQSIETPYGTMELIKHPLMEKHVRTL